MKTVINELKITLTAASENEALARAYISLFVSRFDPTTSELADIRFAVSEAVTNCVVHAYRGKKGKIYINAALYSDRSLNVEITDRGCGIADIGLAMTPLYTTDAAGERSGMGFAIMQSFMDRVRVKSVPGKGTKVFMSKKLK